MGAGSPAGRSVHPPGGSVIGAELLNSGVLMGLIVCITAVVVVGMAVARRQKDRADRLAEARRETDKRSAEYEVELRPNGRRRSY